MRFIGLTFFVMLLMGCQYDPYAHQFTTVEPNPSDIIGEYILKKQTISIDGLSILGGRQCMIHLREGGDLVFTNYPAWSESSASGSGKFVKLYSTTGRWSCEIVGGVSIGTSSCSTWGIRTKETDSRLLGHHFTLTGNVPPYGIIMTYGDPDAGTVLEFERLP